MGACSYTMFTLEFYGALRLKVSSPSSRFGNGSSSTPLSPKPLHRLGSRNGNILGCYCCIYGSKWVFSSSVCVFVAEIITKEGKEPLTPDKNNFEQRGAAASMINDGHIAA